MRSIIEIVIAAIVITATLYWPVVSGSQPVFAGQFNTVDGSFFLVRTFDALATLSLFTIAAYRLIPIEFDRGHYYRFMLVALGMLTVLTSIEYAFDYIVLRIFNLPTQPGQITQALLDNPQHRSVSSSILPGNIATFTLGVLYGFSRDWFEKARRQRLLMMEKHETELRLLKNQLGPHFFFNALNNILAIAQRNDDEETGSAIVQLADVMRYITYDSDNAEIPIEAEFEAIRNYFELSRLKWRKEVAPDLQLNINGDFANMMISPLLLLGLVENAVKHGIDDKGNGFIHIQSSTQDGNFSFIITNSINPESSAADPGGLGINNMRKRLNLLYPGAGRLTVEADDKRYTAKIMIKLEV